MLISSKTPLAVIAGTALPSDSNPVPFLKARYIATDLRDESHNLMTGNEWKGGYPIKIIDTLYVCMTNTAVANRNPDVMIPQFWLLVCEWLEGLPLSSRCVTDD